MLIERIAVALGFDVSKEQRRGVRLFVFAMIGGVLFGALEFFPLFLATAVIWPSGQGPLLAFALAPFAFAAGTGLGAISAWRD